MKAQNQNTGLPLDGTTTSEESQNNSRYSSKEIKGSPFTAINLEGKWFIAWGEWRLSDELESHEELERYMDEEKWNVICAYCIALQQAARRYDKEMQRTPEQQEVENTLQQMEKELDLIQDWETKY